MAMILERIARLPRNGHKTKRILLLGLAYATPIVILAYILCRLTVNVPYWDDYDTILGWFSCPWPDRLEHLLDLHNEHRLMTARIVFEAIYRTLGHFDFQLCMTVGGMFLVGYALLIGKMMRPAGRYFHWVFCPLFWLLVSFIQYENLCWAMTAASNFQVHFWALLALLSAGRCTRAAMEVPFAIVCAILATLSVGGGMAVWPCLVLTAALRKRTPSAVAYALSGLLAIALYFVHFTSPCNGNGTFSLTNAVLFFVSFAGAWVPCFPLALITGALTLGFLGYFAIRLRTIRDSLPLLFAIYLLGNMAAAALFRSSDCHAAISFRYILLPISLLACTATLFVENVNLSARAMKLLCGLFASGSVFYSVAFLAVGGPRFAWRNEIMRHNILCWPTHPDVLRSAKPEVDGILLEKCRSAGIYDPKWLLKPGETPPEKPIKWLR